MGKFHVLHIYHNTKKTILITLKNSYKSITKENSLKEKWAKDTNKFKTGKENSVNMWENVQNN